MLDHTQEEYDDFQAGATEYFVIPAKIIGDIGIPMAVEFKPNGINGWSFENIKIDFAILDKKKSDDQDLFYKRKLGMIFTREDFLNNYATLVDQIAFAGIGSISLEDIWWENLFYAKKGAILYAKDLPNQSDAVSGNKTIPVSTQMIVVDTRNSGVPIPWNTSRTTNVSSGEVMKALQREE